MLITRWFEWQQGELTTSGCPRQSLPPMGGGDAAGPWGSELQSHVSAAYPFCGGTERVVVSLTAGYEQSSQDVLKQTSASWLRRWHQTFLSENQHSLELWILRFLQITQRRLFNKDINTYYIQVSVQLHLKLSFCWRAQCLYIKIWYDE